MTKQRRDELREAIRHGYGALAFYQLPTAEELRALLDSDERLEAVQEWAQGTDPFLSGGYAGAQIDVRELLRVKREEA